jgi:hypothetical protein
MVFEGQELRERIARTPNEIEPPQCARALLQSALNRRRARLGSGPLRGHRKSSPDSISAKSYAEVCTQRRKPHNAAPKRRGRSKHRSSTGPGASACLE